MIVYVELFPFIQTGPCSLACCMSAQAARSLPVWGHPSLWWIPVGRRSGLCHLFKVCHSGLGGPRPWQGWPFSRCDMRFALSSPHRPPWALGWSFDLEPVHLRWWRNMPHSTKLFAPEPGTVSTSPAAMNPARSGSPGRNLALCKSLLNVITVSSMLELLE